MTQAVIIDNSIVARWFHPSGTTKDLAYSDKVLASLQNADINPVAPFILTMELPNVLHALARNGELEGNIDTALMHFEHLNFEVVTTDCKASLYMQTLSKLCALYKISAYDAAYLELALRLNCPLLTIDKELKKAANKANVITNPKNIF